MGPRLFGIPATESPVVAVIRRGPSGWCHLGRWDPDAGTYEPGAWTRGAIYPQRCDLSPDGRWVVTFTLKASSSWGPGATFVAVSRLPWLTALAAWGTDGTWTRGLCFVPRGSAAYPPPPPDVGDLAPLLRRYALDRRRPRTFAVERDRGWTETEDTPPRGDDDPWDERRIDRLTMEKPRPGDGVTRLLVRGWYAAYRGGEPGRGPARYAVADGGARELPLHGVQWADWTRDGRLLVATTDGELQVREDPRDPAAVWRFDCASLLPDPAPPPALAHDW
jgi:hypothetical protein